MEAYFNRATQITAATSGRVTPAELYQLAQTGGTAAQGLTLEGLTSLVSPISEMGGSRTGTALQTLFQNVVAGRVQQKGLMEWQRLGLLDKSKVEYNKSGIVKSMQPGAITIADMLQKNPLEFADKLAEAMAKHGVDTHDPDAVIKELGALKLPRTAAEILSLLINQRDRVVKESSLTTNAKDSNGLYSQALDSDMGKLKILSAQWEDMKASMGKPLMEVATGLAQGLLPITRFFAEHPTVATYAAKTLLVSKGLAAIIETGATLKRSGIPDWFSKIPASKKTELILDTNGVREGVSRTSGMLSRTPSVLKLSVAFLVADTVIEQILKWKQEYDDNRNNLSANIESGRAGYNSLVAKGHAFNGQATPEERDSLVKTTLNTMKRGNDLELSLQSPFERNILESFRLANFGATWASPNFDPKEAASVWRGKMPQLSDPQIMAGVIRDVMRGEIKASPDGREKLFKSLEMVDPATYKQAMNIVTDEMAKVGKASEQGSKVLGDLFTATGRLPASLNSFGSSLDTLSAKIDGITINPPSFDLGGIGGGAGGHTFGLGQPGQKVVRPSLFPSKASGGLVNRGGFVEVHDREAILPADVTREWRDGDFAGTPDFSAFAQPASRSEVRIGSISISVPPGSTAAADPQALARFVASEVARQVAEATEQLHDPRYVDMLTARAIDLSSERI